MLREGGTKRYNRRRREDGWFAVATAAGRIFPRKFDLMHNPKETL